MSIQRLIPSSPILDIEKEINAIEKELPIVGNSTILNAVRTKTLENLTRVEMLEYAYKLSQVNKVKSNQIDEFAKEFASHIEKLDYYEILKLIEKQKRCDYNATRRF